MKITPYINFSGNAEEALHFYAGALGGDVVAISRYGDSPMKVAEEHQQKLIHARLQVGDNVIMMSDVFGDRTVSANGNIQLSVEMDSVEQMDKVFAKMAEGGEVTMPLQDQFWGARFGMLKDKYGISWMFNHEKPKQ